MDNSVIVLLINDDARAVRARYEPGGKTETFKTLDQDIAVGDICVVPSSTRHEYTTVKICEVDYDVNFDTETDVRWIVQKVDTSSFDELKGMEAEAISAVQSAERRRKREALRASMFADHEAKIRTLALANTADGDDEVTE